MTEQMAKECIQGKLDCMKTCDVFDCKNTDECDNCIYCYSQGNFGEQKKAFETAIQALEEIQQYRAIGTVEELQALKEKRDKGLLLELPCKVGAEVYVIIDDCNGDVFDCMHDCEHCREHFRGIETRTFSLNMFDAIGKDVFLTKEEAEQHLDWE